MLMMFVIKVNITLSNFPVVKVINEVDWVSISRVRMESLNTNTKFSPFFTFGGSQILNVKTFTSDIKTLLQIVMQGKEIYIQWGK